MQGKVWAVKKEKKSISITTLIYSYILKFQRVNPVNYVGV